MKYSPVIFLFINFVLPEFILLSFYKRVLHVHFQRKDASVGQSVVTTQGVPQHLVNNPAISQHMMCGQTVPLSQHMMSRHLVTSQPVMSSSISGLQQVPCSELLVQNATIICDMFIFIPIYNIVWIHL
jgi:hypothetical protein